MKYAGKIIRRTGWNPTDVTTFPFNTDNLDDVFLLIKNAETEDTLVLQVDIWNEERRDQMASGGN